jgi:hypothetical protein
VFPFVPRPFRYLLLFNRRDAYADIMLLELHDPSTWETLPLTTFNEDGDLVDERNQVLAVGRDILVDSEGNHIVTDNDNLCVWELDYRIKRVVKTKINTFVPDDADAD